MESKQESTEINSQVKSGERTECVRHGLKTKFICTSLECAYETRQICQNCLVNDHYLQHNRNMVAVSDLRQYGEKHRFFHNWPQNREVQMLMRSVNVCRETYLSEKSEDLQRLNYFFESVAEIDQGVRETLVRELEKDQQRQLEYFEVFVSRIGEIYDLGGLRDEYLKRNELVSDGFIELEVVRIEEREKKTLEQLVKQFNTQKNDSLIVDQELVKRRIEEIKADPKKSHEIQYYLEILRPRKYQRTLSFVKKEVKTSQNPLLQRNYKKIVRLNLQKYIQKVKKGKMDRNEFELETLLSQKTIDYLISRTETLEEGHLEQILSLINPKIRFMKALTTKMNGLNQQVQDFEKFSDRMYEIRPVNKQFKIDWRTLDKHLIPEMMNMTLYTFLKLKNYPEACSRILHARRKRWQINYLMSIVESYVQQRPEKVRHIVDFAGGRGDYGLIVAHFFPQIRVTVADIKKQSLTQVKYRARQVGLQNVRVYCGDIRDFSQDFDLALGLHSCGGLTDIILEKCAERHSDFIICTCCFGKIKFWRDKFKYPRSLENLDPQNYLEICKTAENEEWSQIDESYNEQPEICEQYKEFAQNLELTDKLNFIDIREQIYETSRQAKRLINSDRLQTYSKNCPNVRILEIPRECTSKNQVLVSF